MYPVIVMAMEACANNAVTTLLGRDLSRAVELWERSRGYRQSTRLEDGT
jgi:hypothetical protein